MNPEHYQTIEIEPEDDGLVVARLNLPDSGNAIVGRLHTEMSRLVADFDYSAQDKVLLLSAAGPDFMAGMKQAVQGWLSQTEGSDASSSAPAPDRDVWFEARRMVDAFLECRKPIISAVPGRAFSLGSTVALLADVCVAGRSTVFGDQHVQMGLAAGDGGQVILPLLMGPNRAKYYLMTGDTIDAAEADRLGLVNFVVDDDQVYSKAHEIAVRLANGPTQAINASKYAISQWMRTQAAQILPLSLTLEQNTHFTSDSKEGLAALAEDREPKFTGE